MQAFRSVGLPGFQTCMCKRDISQNKS